MRIVANCTFITILLLIIYVWTNMNILPIQIYWRIKILFCAIAYPLKLNFNEMNWEYWFFQRRKTKIYLHSYIRCCRYVIGHEIKFLGKCLRNRPFVLGIQSQIFSSSFKCNIRQRSQRKKKPFTALFIGLHRWNFENQIRIFYWIKSLKLWE